MNRVYQCLIYHEEWVILDSMNSPRLVMIDGNIVNNDDNMCILVIANYLLFHRVLLSLIVNEWLI